MTSRRDRPAGHCLSASRIAYLRLAPTDDSGSDGGELYDRKTVEALRSAGCEVETIEVGRRRRVGVPLWAKSIDRDARDRLAELKVRGWRIVCSHEGTFLIAEPGKIDVLLVHNYFPAFSFPEQRLLTAYYRIGAHAYFGRAFNSARWIVFLSARDRRYATEHYPALREIAVCIPPPPREGPLGKRRVDIVHVSGSDKWLPKRLSKLSDADRARFLASGFDLQDFGSKLFPAFAFIPERFLVGFKLKLMQMIYCRDVIASCCDLDEEINSICPGYPFYRQVTSASDAVAHFHNVRQRNSIHEIDKCFAERMADWNVPSWGELGGRLVGLAAGTVCGP